MHSSESRSEPKTPANMPSLRQLELAFQTTDPPTSILSLRERPTTKSPGEGKLVVSSRDVDLELQARKLLRSVGAKRIATELRIEWNSRLKTTAGRADYRRKVISLNPRLIEHPTEIDRTLRHELAHIVAQFREKVGGRFHRTGPNGKRLAAIWESPTKSAVIRCRFLRSVMHRVSSIVVRIAGMISLAYARSSAQSHVSPVAARITVASSMFVFV